jgi:tetratricopeptide (TPR) repeat protein
MTISLFESFGETERSIIYLDELQNNGSVFYTFAGGLLYITLNAELAPKAEEYFLRALELRPNAPDPAIYQGLGFASLHQNRIDLAIENFKKYLCLVTTDAQISEFVGKLMAGEKPIQVKQPIAEKSSKSWWKLW